MSGSNVCLLLEDIAHCNSIPLFANKITEVEVSHPDLSPEEQSFKMNKCCIKSTLDVERLSYTNDTK